MFPASAEPNLAYVALRAFPAVIVGGLEYWTKGDEIQEPRLVAKLKELSGGKLLRIPAETSSRARPRIGRIGQAKKVLFIPTGAERFKVSLYFAHRRCQNYCLFELAFELLQITIASGIDINHCGGQGSIKAGRPGFRISNQWNILRLGHLS